MIEFALALGSFLAAHLIPASPRLRALLVAAMGRGAYLAVYSALSVALLAWLILAARRAETIALWNPAPWQWWFALTVMPIAIFLLVAGLAEPNPLSISLRRGSEPGAIVGITRHPILWAFLLWAAAHLAPNGDLVALILFGGMAIFSLLGFALLDAKARRRLGSERWTRLSGGTSIVPFAALLSGRARVGVAAPLVAAAIAAAALYGWFVLQGHRILIGADPLALVQLARPPCYG